MPCCAVAPLFTAATHSAEWGSMVLILAAFGVQLRPGDTHGRQPQGVEATRHPRSHSWRRHHRLTPCAPSGRIGPGRPAATALRGSSTAQGRGSGGSRGQGHPCARAASGPICDVVATIRRRLRARFRSARRAFTIALRDGIAVQTCAPSQDACLPRRFVWRFSRPRGFPTKFTAGRRCDRQCQREMDSCEWRLLATCFPMFSCPGPCDRRKCWAANALAQDDRTRRAANR
mmetsp:Transcript_23993/g.69413  ORF Transcript_23993/g.69413 Transcript_23993/m.69413 type:complete len:231 (-) Transcript_23993:232-924(-)